MGSDIPGASPPGQASIRAAHPLARQLAQRVTDRRTEVLDFASGSGRNTAALIAYGFTVVAISDVDAASGDPLRPYEPARFGAALSTHGLLHGTPAEIAGRLGSIAHHLRAGGLLAATFGSAHDTRYGRGVRVGPSAYAPREGDERGVAHAYFTRTALRAMLERWFRIDAIGQHDADEIAGSWAHHAQPLAGAVHWFVEAVRY